MSVTDVEDSPSLMLFDVQRFCTNDGPGVRTIVFLSGCGLRCAWCHNPEGQRMARVLAHNAALCTGCGACGAVCPSHAISFEGGVKSVDRSKCTACGQCAEVCPTGACKVFGRRVTPQQLLAEVVSDKPYFDASGGGITLSGGDPLLQSSVVAVFLKLCKEAGIHCCVETAGYYKSSAIEEVMPFVDHWLFDIKAWGDNAHMRCAGTAQDKVLQSARLLVERSQVPVQFRMVIVPGYNNDSESLASVAEFLHELGKPSITLLQYHATYKNKLNSVGAPPLPADLEIDDATSIQAIKDAASQMKDHSLEVLLHSEPVSKPNDYDSWPKLTDRVVKLKEAVLNSPRSACHERAVLMSPTLTRRAETSGDQLLRKADALVYYVEHRTDKIYPGELIVGNFTSKRLAGHIYPEYHGLALFEEILFINNRERNPLQMSLSERFKVFATLVNHFGDNVTSAALGFIQAAKQAHPRDYVINSSASHSHLILDYQQLLEKGTRGIIADAKRRADALEPADPRKDFYRAVTVVCGAVETLAHKYATLAKNESWLEKDPVRIAELNRIAETCERVPANPASSFVEAIQSVLFYFICATAECMENGLSLGRIDQYLYPYYKRDLDNGVITETDAVELICCFCVKMSEVIPILSSLLSQIHGGMMSGQAADIGGLKPDGTDGTNELTFAFLKAMNIIRMRQPNMHARVHEGSPTEYVRAISHLLHTGANTPAIFNDHAVIGAFMKNAHLFPGLTQEDANDYAIVGCVEIVLGGRHFGSTDAAIINIVAPFERALGTKSDVKKGWVDWAWNSMFGKKETQQPYRKHFVECESMEEVLECYRHWLDATVEECITIEQKIDAANRIYPVPLCSTLLVGCMENGKDATDGGTRYNSSGVQCVGVADLADSLAAIEEVVFTKRLCTMKQLVKALETNFKNDPILQGYLLRASKYGNDIPSVDKYVGIVVDMFSDSLVRFKNSRGGFYVAGVYSMTTHILWGSQAGALPSGRPAGKPFANGCSVCDGKDMKGPTATLNSAASLSRSVVGSAEGKPAPLDRCLNGVTVNLSINTSAGSMVGETGLSAIEALIRGYVTTGGMQVQVNAWDSKLIARALEHPEEFRNLLVRVSGYCSLWSDLSPEVRHSIAARVAHAASD